MNKPAEQHVFQYIALAGAVAAILATGVSQYANLKTSKLQADDQVIHATEIAESAVNKVAECIWESTGTCSMHDGQVLTALSSAKAATQGLKADAALQAASAQADALYAESIKCHVDAQAHVVSTLRTPDAAERGTCDNPRSLASAILVSSSSVTTEKAAVQIAQLERFNNSARFALAAALGVLFSGLGGIVGFSWISRNKKPA